MKVLILGGYGSFGGRLARLLLLDGDQVWIAGRHPEKAKAFAARHGGIPLGLDRTKSLTPICGIDPDMIVDAAGPFQTYGEDPYRVVRFCIERGIHYLDLSDDANFTAGIGKLDRRAEQAGIVALSGVSSVPAISSAAVEALASGFTGIQLINMAILPGNRAPRGRSVMASILSQAGEPMEVWRGGRWRQARGWSQAKTVTLDKGIRRRASLIGAPDILLFPDRFKAQSVIFRAGLELSVMQRGLEILSWLRGRRFLPGLTCFLTFLHWFAKILEPLGTDRGGMVVEVTGESADGFEKRSWQLLAETGDGPFIPAIPVLAIIRNLKDIKRGARPCLAELPLQRYEDAMSGLAVETRISSKPCPPVFQQILGEKWRALPKTVQRSHCVQDIAHFSGRCEVTRGTGWIARFAAGLFGFPGPGNNIPLTVTKTRTIKGEIWERNFGRRIFRSFITPSKPGHCRERFRVFTFELALTVQDNALYFPVRRGWFLGMPLPAIFLPRSDAREYETDEAFRFDVALYAPFGAGLIVRYEGSVSPEYSSASFSSPLRS